MWNPARWFALPITLSTRPNPPPAKSFCEITGALASRRPNKGCLGYVETHPCAISGASAGCCTTGLPCLLGGGGGFLGGLGGGGCFATALGFGRGSRRFT